MTPKYKFVDTTSFNGKTIRLIRALRSFGNVKKDQDGGWIESESNLSHDGDCWVGYSAVVCGDSKVTGNIVVAKNTRFLHTVDEETLKIPSFDKRWSINYSGFDKKSGEHFVRVGCQIHSITKWKNESFRSGLVSEYNMTKSEEREFLKILEGFESKYCSKQDPFVKIEENILSLKKTVTEALKTETISLISALQVPPVKTTKSGPQRDKFGRFARKT